VFINGIASLAAEQEKKAEDFKTFARWIDQRGPFGVVIDGANVALFGKNGRSFRGQLQMAFDFSQIEAALAHCTARHPELNPLVLLHAGRLKGPKASEPRAKALLQQWKASGILYVTPFGANDDWYWMYAAAKAGGSGLLVSNDEMRDHIFKLLAPKFFKRWKSRHQVKFGFAGPRRFQAEYPAPFSTAAQELPSGAWMFPGEDLSWLWAGPER